MSDDSADAIETILPTFGLLVPTNWSNSAPLDTDAINEWAKEILRVLPSLDAARLDEDLRDYLRSMIETGMVKFYTCVQSVPDATRLIVFTCSLSAIANPTHDLEREYTEILKVGDAGWDAPPSMVTMHHGVAGEYLRAERRIHETGPMPWRISREVRYFFRHPNAEVMAILSGTSPNVMDQSVFDLFDRVAATFHWAQPELP
jgi:hypothetical protein